MDTTEFSTESVKYVSKEGAAAGGNPIRLEVALKPARQPV